MDTKKLSETDIITKFIMPAVKCAGWNLMTQIRQEVKLRDGNVIVRGQLGVRKTVESADIVLNPPLVEQHRIVSKVDELMALCDQLKARLNDAQTTQLHLADAVVEQTLA